MKIRISLTIFVIAALFAAGCSSGKMASSGKSKPQVKNIILFIGDGMGTAQVYAAMSIASEPLVLESFPYSGFSNTWSASHYVTDSGAGGTAIAAGIKTTNGMIGTAPDSSAVPSITEIVKSEGLATGILSTSAVTHATPASFVAHNAGRGNYEDIAVDFLKGTADIFIGGGEDHFRNREDGKDLAVPLKEQGYDVVYTLDDLRKSSSPKIAGLLAKEHMPTAAEGRMGILAEMTRKTIEILSKDEDGFFMMVEGSMIDWGGHAKDFNYTASEVIDLDMAVKVAKEFAEKDGKTLVVVTADHETGGLTLPGGNRDQKKVVSSFIPSGAHTAVMVPIFSYGPGAEKFSGIHDNTFFMNQFLELLNIKR
ncbi:MAG: alkaline phosphatase [Bacteroidales bacterium]|nr:alkaline phosphatase [Bacteroidales bacterium]